ncbi:MAG: Zn-dependent protease [Mariniblastus sp.]|jgi:Zn-dependent protease
MRLKIGRVAEIDIFLHWTYVFLPVYIVYRCRYEAQMPWPMVLVMLCLVCALFLCVLMHEYGHALMARRYGIGTRDILITPIGGLARLDRMSSDPVQELMITLAGPSVNLVIAVGLAIGLWFSGASVGLESRFEWGDVFGILMWMNLALFLFNLLPAFPMDGGRVLRSVLAMMMPHHRATMIAGRIGQVLAITFGGYAIGSRQYLLVLVSIFVFAAAQMEMRYSQALARGEIPPVGETLKP